MSDSSPPAPTDEVSRNKKHVSFVSPSPSVPSVSSPSSSPLRLLENDTGWGPDVPANRTENQVAPASTPRHPSTSNSSLLFSANYPSPSSQSFPNHSDAGVYQNLSPMPFAPPFPPQPPQQRVPTPQGNSLSLYSRQYPGPYFMGQGPFSHAQGFIMNSPMFFDNNNTADNFMEKLLQHTIRGAEFDSSARSPPPRCHPGTRLAIIKRCLSFIVECNGKEKLRWIVGAAGVGKSAVMQSVAENIPDGFICASVFLSVDGRQDGNKIMATIAYQLAVQCGPYCQFIRHEISRDPTLPHKALSVQFKKFITEPFVLHHLLDPPRRILVLIDGLDECDNPRTQQELLRLISNLGISQPNSPIVWVVASRPEPHITTFLDRINVAAAHTSEKIAIDSEEACKDVEQYLRDELNEVKLASLSLRRKSHWPGKPRLAKIAAAASGLFAYASAVVEYISNPSLGDPVSLLVDVLAVIEGTKLRLSPGMDHPMDHLDALYTRIISNIPDGVKRDTRNLLLLCLAENRSKNQFRLQCNLLGLGEGAAYGAVHRIHSVVKVPNPENADEQCLECFHHSFEHYLSDSDRSKFFRNAQNEADELATQVSLRVVKEVQDDSDAKFGGESIVRENGGNLVGTLDACATISLSWPGDERFKLTDDQLRFMLYSNAVTGVASRFKSGTLL